MGNLLLSQHHQAGRETGQKAFTKKHQAFLTLWASKSFMGFKEPLTSAGKSVNPRDNMIMEDRGPHHQADYSPFTPPKKKARVLVYKDRGLEDKGACTS